MLLKPSSYKVTFPVWWGKGALKQPVCKRGSCVPLGDPGPGLRKAPAAAVWALAWHIVVNIAAWQAGGAPVYGGLVLLGTARSAGEDKSGLRCVTTSQITPTVSPLHLE